MGKFVESLKGLYTTAEDVGTNVQDMVTVRQETKHVTGLPREMGSSGDPSPFTAIVVFLGIKACVEKTGGKDLSIASPSRCGNVAARSTCEGGREALRPTVVGRR
jgi:glutamate dehydrogenase/leucine dehydrogenase